MPPLLTALADPVFGGRASAAGFLGNRGPAFGLNFLTPAFDARGTFTRASGSASRVDPSGLLVVNGSGSPRITYDPTGTLLPLGYLAEPQVQNPLTNTGPLTDWTASSATMTANDAVAPDGTLTAVKVTETAATATGHNLNSPAISVTANLLYTFSCFVKVGTRQRVSVALTGTSAFVGGNSRMRARFDNGTVTLNGGATAGGMIPYGNGWYRLWVSATAQAVPTGQGAKVYLTDDANSISYDGDTGKYAWLWGVQLEQGPLTGYIPTTATAVTRASDLALWDNIELWFTFTQGGTVIAEAIWPVVPATGGHYLWNTADNLGTELLGVYKAASGSETAVNVTVGGVSTPLTGLGTKPVTAGRVFRHVLSWDGAGGFWDAANGVAGTPVTGVGMPGTIKKLSIGCLHTGSNVLNAIMRQWYFIPGATPLSECRGLSIP